MLKSDYYDGIINRLFKSFENMGVSIKDKSGEYRSYEEMLIDTICYWHMLPQDRRKDFTEAFFEKWRYDACQEIDVDPEAQIIIKKD